VPDLTSPFHFCTLAGMKVHIQTGPTIRAGLLILLGLSMLSAGSASIAALDASTLGPKNHGATITVRITGFRNERGIARVTLFRDSKGFPDNATLAFRTHSAVVTNGQAVVDFENIPFDDYAIGVLHDENENGRMDTNWLGRPIEGYGASNNPHNRISAPSFKSALFRFTPPSLTLSITLNY
jgi:uncharacterized protein (DUF2141 family)